MHPFSPIALWLFLAATTTSSITTILEVFPASRTITEYTHYGLILTQNPSSTVVIISCTPECIPVTATYDSTTLIETASETNAGPSGEETTIVTATCAFLQTNSGSVTQVASCSEADFTKTGDSDGGWETVEKVYENYLRVPVTASYQDGEAYNISATATP